MSPAGATFAHDWEARILAAPPLIAPARQYVWPHAIAGEEDALARGALRLEVRVPGAGSYLLTCALGFAEPSLPTGVWSCPDPATLCAVAGGYAYLGRAATPEHPVLLDLRPATAVLAAERHGLLLFAGFHTLLAWGSAGEVWRTRRLSWDGLTLGAIDGDVLHGTGWDLPADREVPFTVDLRTGGATGGGWQG